jgi:hypothetical protein
MAFLEKMVNSELQGEKRAMMRYYAIIFQRKSAHGGTPSTIAVMSPQRPAPEKVSALLKQITGDDLLDSSVIIQHHPDWSHENLRSTDVPLYRLD